MLININLCGLRPISIVTSKQCKIESASSKWYCDVYCYAIESSECASNRTTGKIILREKPHHIQITSKRTEVEKCCETQKKTQNRMRDREQWRKQQQIKRHPKDTYNDVVDDTKSEWKQNCIFENYLRDASCVKWKCMHMHTNTPSALIIQVAATIAAVTAATPQNINPIILFFVSLLFFCCCFQTNIPCLLPLDFLECHLKSLVPSIFS